MSNKKKSLKLSAPVKKLILENRWKELVQLGSAIIAKSPEIAEGYFGRGIAKRFLDDFQGAIDDCTKALDIDDENVIAYINRGIAKRNLDDFQGAIDDYTKALGIDNKNVIAYINRGIAEYKLKNYKNSIKDADEVMELDKTFNNSYILVANMTRDIKEEETRTTVFKHVVEVAIAVSALKNKLRKCTDNVFHYTRLDTLQALSKGKNFRFYNTSYMNDTQEGEVFFDILPEGNELKRFLYQDKNTLTTDAYVGSFVIEEDKGENGDLMFWRAYGKHDNIEGAGARLRFPNKNFPVILAKDDICPNENSLDSDKSINNSSEKFNANREENTLINVVYVDKIEDIEDIEDIRDSIEDVSEQLKHIQKVCDKEEDAETKKAILVNTRACLDRVRFFFKQKAFNYEKEARVVIFKSLTEEGDVDESVEIDNSENGMPYKLYVKLSDSFCCDKITLGPKTPNRDEFRLWLRRVWGKRAKEEKEKKETIPVNKSNIPMR